jgi:hypothetical protein
LERASGEDADRKPDDERDDAEKRHVMAENVEQWFLKDCEIHCR